jgi:general secretion pathway protein A
MFLDFYKLREQPFGVTPDPRFLYLSAAHREALASLLCGVETERGFLALIAEPGMGKTTLLFQLREMLQATARTVFLFQTQCDSRELLRYLLSNLGIDAPRQDIVGIHDKLNEALAREMLAGRRFVLVIDEAQNLDEPVLETVRLLSNFETPRAKMLQILLAGQPSLASKLAHPRLAQLRQRIGILGRLEPLDGAEVARYIHHRLHAAGYEGSPLFTPGAVEVVAARSRGIPRNINNLCFGALSAGYALGRQKIDSAIVEEAAADLDMDRLAPKPRATERSIPLARPQGPQLSYPGTAKSSLGVRAARTVALLALLALGGLLSFSLLGRPSRVASDPVTPAASEPLGPRTEPDAPVASLPSADAPLEQASPEARSSDTLTVIVQPKQTLRQISLEYLGRSDDRLIEEIRELNPGITDPNRIEIGQAIQLPRRSHSLADGDKSEAAGPRDHE